MEKRKSLQFTGSNESHEWIIRCHFPVFRIISSMLLFCMLSKLQPHAKAEESEWSGIDYTCLGT